MKAGRSSLIASFVLCLPLVAQAKDEVNAAGSQALPKAEPSAGGASSGSLTTDPATGEAAKIDGKALAAEAAEDTDAIEESPDGLRTSKRPFGVVVESSIGLLAFVGDFGKVAPPALLLRMQAGVEIFRFLMPFAEGEIAMTDTSKSQDETKQRAVPIYSFGGGLRVTIRPTSRVGVFVQGSVGALKADVPTNSLAVLGFRDAESLGMYLGGRLGAEWYQRDRHMAFALHAGVRDALGFEKTSQGTTPLAIDGVFALRYTF